MLVPFHMSRRIALTKHFFVAAAAACSSHYSRYVVLFVAESVRSKRLASVGSASTGVGTHDTGDQIVIRNPQ